MMAGLISSEVNTFTTAVAGSGAGIISISRFRFSLPAGLAGHAPELGPRRSRSLPGGLGEESEEEEICVPRYSSLDTGDSLAHILDSDSDGDLDPPRRTGQAGTELELELEHWTHTDLQEVGLQVGRTSQCCVCTECRCGGAACCWRTTCCTTTASWRGGWCSRSGPGPGWPP